MADGRVYMLQPSFATGEISPDVASRVDLDKYQSALLQAKNFFIRPYGSAYRRPGLEHKTGIAAVELEDNVRLQEFAVDVNTGYLLVFTARYLYIYREESNVLTLKKTLSTPFYNADLPRLRFAQSADVMFIASGKYPVKVLTRKGDTNWTLADFVARPGYFDGTTNVAGTTITPSARGGNPITLTYSGNDDLFTGQEGNWVKITQRVEVQVKNMNLNAGGTDEYTTQGMLAGETGWKIVSHGTWTGWFRIEYSDDNSTWYTLREYTSDDDFNVTESGTFDEPTYVRLTGKITSGALKSQLTRLSYMNDGMARITGVTDGQHADAAVTKRFAAAAAAENWELGSWSEEYGYPSCVAFFQDRLCFAANDRQPYMVWMSRTGDYYNFGTEEVEGTLTDDSAVAVSFISRRDFRIKHLVAQSDLIVMTEGNEWIVSGSSTIKPTEVNPQVQTSRGTTDVVPILVGGQMIYVQRRARTVRDLQYNYTTDSYDGMDLTILAKHITQNAAIVGAAYRQEPDYMMWFVLDDGTCACLTYINEQKVYAWSRMVTDGTIKAVETITAADKENVYFVVHRGNGCWLERLADMADSDEPDDYIMLDCAKRGVNTPASNIITASWLANRTVDVLADGRHIEDVMADSFGSVTLDVPCTNYVIGVPYSSVMELPNIETQMQDGTMQGRKKKVSSVILRLRNSLAGQVGITEAKTDVIKYDELMAQRVTLYSGEKHVTVPNVTTGGFNDWGRVVITSDAPYPLSVASVVRAVVSGG